MADLPEFEEGEFLLDACIIQDLSAKGLGDEALKILSELVSKGKALAISHYAKYELLRDATKEIEQKRLEALEPFKLYEVTGDVLAFAAQLKTLYKDERVDSGISEGDQILAATSVLTGHPIISRNGKDFPRPFFHELHNHHVAYDSGGRHTKAVVFHFLRPNLAFIKKKNQERK